MTEEEELEARDFFRRNSSLFRPRPDHIGFDYWASPSNVRNLYLLEELGLVTVTKHIDSNKYPLDRRVAVHLTPVGEVYRKVLNLR